MLIRVKCPNGHTLKVDDRHAGKKGACPKCKALVTVPEPQKEDEELEDDIVAMLSGPGLMSSSRSRYAANRDELPTRPSDDDDDGESVLGGSTPGGGSGNSSLLKMRRCPQCKKDVPPHYSVCPHCRVYLAEDSMAAGKATAKCPDCGLPSFPGDEVCTNCGAQLFVRK
jgi:hypothetical protein